MAEAGRPTKYDSAFCDQVIEAGAKGFSLAAFAGMIGVCRDTVQEWARVHPEFSAAVKAHKAKRAWIWEQRLMRIADEGGGNGSATAIIFALKNVAPEEFADRVVNQHTGPNDGPVPLGVSDVSDLEIARRFAFILQSGVRAQARIEAADAGQPDQTGLPPIRWK
jgi:hypothetical protein